MATTVPVQHVLADLIKHLDILVEGTGFNAGAIDRRALRDKLAALVVRHLADYGDAQPVYDI